MLNAPSPRLEVESIIRPPQWAATEVRHHQAALFIGFAQLLCHGAGHPLVVQGVGAAIAGQQGMAGYPGQGLHFIHGDGVAHIGGQAVCPAHAVGDDSAQVGRVLPVDPAAQIPEHGLVHPVHAGIHRLQQSADGNDPVHVPGVEARLPQTSVDDTGAVIRLVQHGGKGLQLLSRMGNGLREFSFKPVVYGHLGGGGRG